MARRRHGGCFALFDVSANCQVLFKKETYMKLVVLYLASVGRSGPNGRAADIKSEANGLTRHSSLSVLFRPYSPKDSDTLPAIRSTFCSVA
jgi:hypothetical protein